MRLSISNIAWDVAEDDAVCALLLAAGIDQVDIAPGKYFSDPENVSPGAVAAARKLWEARGFHIAGMQALLFGTSGMNLFGDDGAMLQRLASVCRIGGALGARALTFGAPANRNREGLDDGTAQKMAVDFFRRIGDAAHKAGVVFCLEPVPAAYNCNFMVTTRETAHIVRAVDHPAVALQLDVGAMAVNREVPQEMVTEFAPLIGHIHASEPQLAVLGDGGAPHRETAAALRQYMPERTVTIEMAPAKSEPHLAAIARAIGVAQLHYGAIEGP